MSQSNNNYQSQSNGSSRTLSNGNSSAYSNANRSSSTLNNSNNTYYGSMSANNPNKYSSNLNQNSAPVSQTNQPTTFSTLDLNLMQELDRVKWTTQEDDLLKKLFQHFNGEFQHVSAQMNSIFFSNKFTPQLCEYRWKYYLDPRINREEFSPNEEYHMFCMLRKQDLYSGLFWFQVSESFKQRPPSVLKSNTGRLIQKCLLFLNDNLSQNKLLKKRYQQRVKLFSIDLIVALFRLGKEKMKRMGPNTILVQCVDQCSIMLNLIDTTISMINQGRELRGEDIGDQAISRFHTMMECLIFIDTIYRIYHKIIPYHTGEQADRDRMEILLPNKKTIIHHQIGMNNQDDHQKSILYDDQIFDTLHKEEIRLIYNSDILNSFNTYFNFAIE